jgi:hypothetical protein
MKYRPTKIPKSPSTRFAVRFRIAMPGDTSKLCTASAENVVNAPMTPTPKKIRVSRLKAPI